MLVLSLLVLFSFSASSAGQAICSDNNGGMYMPNNTYKDNLISLAKLLFASAAEEHSAVGGAGTGPDKVYGAVLCRGDSDSSDCHKRLTKALDEAINSKAGDSYSLQSNKDVTYYYDEYQAQISFSDKDFLSSFSNMPRCTVNTNLNSVTATVTERFEDLVTKLIDALADVVVSQADKYAVGKVWFEETGQTVYAMAQCIHDMPYERCAVCLDDIISHRQSNISAGQMGAAFLGVWCTLRYETDTQFFTATKMLSLNALPRSKTHFFRWNNAVLVSVGGFLLVLFMSCLVFHIWINTQRRREQTVFKLRRLYLSIQVAINLWRTGGANPEFSLYDFYQIKEATNNFSVDNKLGHGGFGPVYKGRLRSGLKIAVKRLETCSLQGLLEFQNEIQLIAKLQHKNLVKLLGCCIQGDREKLLVYEYLENKSLDYFIFDMVKGAQLNWSNRLHIIDGTAQGLLYLHNYSRLCVVHRDLKASNILLDSVMNPKISDFGMARIFCSNMAESNTTRIVGTQPGNFG
nr:cysteine-rich receptor-like protein kinase 10 isoform X2 [Lolium perenne]